MTDAFLVLPLLDGACGAFTLPQVNEARARAAEMGFRGATAAVPAPAPTEPLLDSEGMAKLLGVHATTVEAMARDGRLPSMRIGKLLRFEPAACLAALRTNPNPK